MLPTLLYNTENMTVESPTIYEFEIQQAQRGLMVKPKTVWICAQNQTVLRCS
jgi:hypothetical protein